MAHGTTAAVCTRQGSAAKAGHCFHADANSIESNWAFVRKVGGCRERKRWDGKEGSGGVDVWDASERRKGWGLMGV